MLYALVSLAILFPPVFILITCLLKKREKQRKSIITAIFMLTIHIAWIVYWYMEINCRTLECMEWSIDSPGFVLFVQELFPLLLIFISFPWYYGLFKKCC